MINTNENHYHRGHTVNDASEIFIRAKQPRQPRVGILKSKAAQHEHDEAGQQQPVLQSLIRRQPNDRALLFAPGRDFLSPDKDVVQRHAADC